MSDGVRQGDADDQRLASEPGGSSASTPRWVKVSAAIALAVVLLIAAMLVFGGGEHGPGRHLGGGDNAAGESRDDARPTEAPEGHEPPPWAPEH